jgi:hypothetical protein
VAERLKNKKISLKNYEEKEARQKAYFIMSYIFFISMIVLVLLSALEYFSII